jgi:F0F1-type ATP synthase alpha subunit
VHASRSAAMQVVLLYGVQRGIFDAIPIEKMREALQLLMDDCTTFNANLLLQLTQEKAMSPAIEASLNELFVSWQKAHGDLFYQGVQGEAKHT